MTDTTFTKTELRSLFPRARGARGISDLGVADYVNVVEDERRRMTDADVVLFLELAAERHAATVRRQARDSERHYGTPSAATGRLRVLKATMRRRNVATAAELRAAAERIRNPAPDLMAELRKSLELAD